MVQYRALLLQRYRRKAQFCQSKIKPIKQNDVQSWIWGKAKGEKKLTEINTRLHIQTREIILCDHNHKHKYFKKYKKKRGKKNKTHFSFLFSLASFGSWMLGLLLLISFVSFCLLYFYFHLRSVFLFIWFYLWHLLHWWLALLFLCFVSSGGWDMAMIFVNITHFHKKKEETPTRERAKAKKKAVRW